MSSAVNMSVPGRSLHDTGDQFIHACDQTPADGWIGYRLHIMQAVLYRAVVLMRNLKKGFLSSRNIRCHVLWITARVKQRQLSSSKALVIGGTCTKTTRLPSRSSGLC